MLADRNPPKSLAAAPTASAAAEQARRVDSATLLGPRGEVFIHHQQQVYRLRVTSLGKLILTK
ncbi:MAG: hemin uptake protein HemP [Rubrivivax sp.]|nr:MAG: hemin uptake protein HemP [Rubrivivax sp.]